METEHEESTDRSVNVWCYGRKGGDEEGKRESGGRDSCSRMGEIVPCWHTDGKIRAEGGIHDANDGKHAGAKSWKDKRVGARCPGRGCVVAESRGILCGKAGSVDTSAGGSAALAGRTKGVPLRSLQEEGGKQGLQEVGWAYGRKQRKHSERG